MQYCSRDLFVSAATHAHTHPFNGPFSGTTQVSHYQKDKINLDFTEASDSECQWHQLGHMQVCTLLQIDNHTSTPSLFFTGRMPFLPPNQQRHSTEGINYFAPGWDAKYCDDRACLFVCLSVCPRAYLWNYTSDLHQFFCTCYLLSWLGPSLAALRYAMYSFLWITSYLHIVAVCTGAGVTLQLPVSGIVRSGG